MITRTRAGFTLIELTIVLVVTSLIALLAYSAAQAGNDTHERLTSHQRDNEAISVTYQLLSDALRHAEPGSRGGTDVFEITDMVDHGSERSQRLTFISRGIVAPLGTSELWTIHIAPSSAGLIVEANPISSSAAPIRTVLPNVRALHIRALPRGTGAFWIATWPTPDLAPTAVELTFVPRPSTRPLPLPPLIARIGLERTP